MRIITGIKPSGIAHIANYFGALRHTLKMQEKKDVEIFFFIADYHSLTTSKSGDEQRNFRKQLLIDLLSLGINLEKTTFFFQSDIPQVCELTWLLSNVTPVALLERGHAYKDNVSKGIAPNAGLFNYPVLMTADILLYDIDLVPVGKDQKQHLEIARDIAGKFNDYYGSKVFKIPEPFISEETAVIPGIDGEKMSKSYNNTIPIFDDLKKQKKRIMSIKTDSTPVEAPKDYKNSIIYNLYSLLASEDKVAEMKADFKKGGTGYGEFKNRLYEEYVSYFSDMFERRKYFEKNSDYVEKIMQDGAKKAKSEADKILQKARKAVGLS